MGRVAILLAGVLIGLPAARAEASGLFERVVIIGASVSANEKAPSPGLLLARHMGTPPESIFTFAEGGAPSGSHLRQLDQVARLNPTIIIAVDLFYHGFKASLFLTSARKRYIRDYVARLDATGAVVLLGNLPSLVLLRHEHVNRYLEELAGEFPRLMLLDVRHLIDGLEPSGMLVHTEAGDVFLRKHDVFADRVHPNVRGSSLMANYMMERISQRYPGRIPSTARLPLGPAAPPQR
ncbi:MAG TPA: SGNH/GDSL hydrolase family protein [Bryobacteraceae bacterium]|nr:SGNH/GDSL hydrolase family protein [Bryobacteraceae bacterium]